MSNEILLNVSSATSNQTGTVQNSNGAKITVSIQADSYGGDGQVVLRANANVTGSSFNTLPDTNTSSGLAEYSDNTFVVIDRLPQGWSLRADLEISSGTATNVLVAAGI